MSPRTSKEPAPRAAEHELPVPAKPLRADAARNRAKLIEAAREVFRERGSDGSLDEIARRAESAPAPSTGTSRPARPSSTR